MTLQISCASTISQWVWRINPCCRGSRDRSGGWLRYKPDDAEARFGLGAALAAQGRRAEAVAEVQQSLSLRPNHSPARELLHQLRN